MSGARRFVRPSAVAVATIFLSLAAGLPPARAGAGGPRTSAGSSKATRPSKRERSGVRAEDDSVRLRPAFRVSRRTESRGSARDAGPVSQAVVEERPRDDVEAEVAIDRASMRPGLCRVEGTRDALAALDARACRHLYLLTAHLRF